ncbi:TPA: hypothetical protein ACFM5D_001301, partial [Neisseria meningitidis]|uniref:hypothetical protein n=2 Tax=Neisseria meningitidis TaxID=487 RepID=UPI002B4ADCFB
RGGLRGYLGKIRRYLGRKQPKTCVWVSAVGRERNFAKVSGFQISAKNAVGNIRGQNQKPPHHLLSTPAPSE